MKTTSERIIWNNSTSLKILQHFMDNPTRDMYGSEVAKETKLSMGAVNKYLKKLAEQRYLLQDTKGRMTFYQLNKDNSEVKHLKISYNLSKPLADKLRKIEEELKSKIYVYGSIARGEDTEKSDWDLLVIRSAGQAEVQEKIANLKARVQTTTYTEEEWNEVALEDPAFYERVERDKVKI